MTTLVVLDSLEALPKSLQLGTGGLAILLTFSPDEQVTRQVESYLTQRYASVEVVTAAGLLDEVALRVREEYGRLVAEAPDKIRIGNQNLREAFTFEGRLSLWWLNEIFGKRSDAYPTFTRLCQLEVVRSIAESRQATECYLISQDTDFWEVILSYCQQTGMPFRNPKPAQPKAGLHPLSLVHIFVSSLVWFGRTTVQTFVARRVARHQPRVSASDKPVCAFHTIYPLLWRGGRYKQDEKYGDTPQAIHASGRLNPMYACTFSADGGHQYVSITEFLRLCRWLRARWTEQHEVPVYLLDAYLSWGDLLRAFSQLGLIWKYYRLERSPAFRAFWQYRGVSFFPLVRQELRIAMRRTPRYLVHALRVRRFVEQTSPCGFIYHLFEFGLGRAVAYGVRTAGTRTALIGVQEGPLAKCKLGAYHHPGELQTEPTRPEDYMVNLPLPDCILLEGTGALERLREAGYPSERLYVGGAPKISRLLQIHRWSERDRPAQVEEDKKVVLVAFGRQDARPMLAACLPVLEREAKYHFVFKLHPRGGISSQEVEQRLAGHTLVGSYAIESGDVYQLIPKADVIVATYSSVAMEAAALGYPVVCLHLPNRVSVTPLLDTEMPRVLFVANSEELIAALKQAVASSVSDDALDHEVEKYCFYRSDGRSAERWAQKIVEVVEASAISAIEEVITSRDVWTVGNEG